jgi:hypothetical protein
MKNLLKSFLFIVKLFFTALIIAFSIASIITYYITAVKFALFLSVCGVVPTCFILLYYYDRWSKDLL